MPAPAKRGRPPAANPPDTSIHMRCTKRARGLIKLAAEAAGMDMTAYLLGLAHEEIFGQPGNAVRADEVSPARAGKIIRIRELAGYTLADRRDEAGRVRLVWARP